MSRIIIVTELFYPDATSTAHILTSIADGLSREHDVMVLCGKSSYGTALTGSDVKEKPYPVFTIDSKKYNKNNLLSRALNLLGNSYKLVRLLSKKVSPADRVIIVTNPAPLIIMSGILKKLKNFHLTVIIHDVFPENTVPARIIASDSNVLYRCLKAVYDRAYSWADRLIVLGHDMADVVNNKVKRFAKPPAIEIIGNWADDYDGYKAGGQNAGKINILYAGNIGRCQGLERFVNTFIESGNPSIKLSFRGNGAVEDTLKDMVAEKGIEHISFGGPFSRDQQFTLLSQCDIALVTLADGMRGLGVPSKSYNIMMAGKPILYIGDPDSEMASIITRYNIGVCFAPSDSHGLREWLSELSLEKRSDLEQMGKRARELAQRDYSKSIILDKYLKTFRNE